MSAMTDSVLIAGESLFIFVCEPGDVKATGKMYLGCYFSIPDLCE
jgi:hypothetical protein